MAHVPIVLVAVLVLTLRRQMAVPVSVHGVARTEDASERARDSRVGK